MSITISFLSQQLNDLHQSDVDAEQSMKNQQKVSQAQDELQGTLSSSPESDDKTGAPQNALMLFLEAVSQMMNGNLTAMASSAQHMEAIDPLMNNINNELSQVDESQTGLSKLSPQKALVAGQEVNVTMVTLEQNLGVLSVGANQDGMNINYESTNNNALGGEASQALGLFSQISKVVV